MSWQGFAPSRIVPPLLTTLLLLVDQADHRVRRLGVELGRVGVLQTADMAGKLDHGDLHAEADTEVGDLFFAGVPGRHDFAFDAAVAESAGNKDAVHAAQMFRGAIAFNVLGVHPHDLDSRRWRRRRV